MGLIDLLIPLVAGGLLLTKPDIFIRKDMDEGEKEKKRIFFRKIGGGLIGVSILSFLSKILIGLSGR